MALVPVNAGTQFFTCYQYRIPAFAGMSGGTRHGRAEKGREPQNAGLLPAVRIGRALVDEADGDWAAGDRSGHAVAEVERCSTASIESRQVSRTAAGASWLA